MSETSLPVLSNVQVLAIWETLVKNGYNANVQFNYYGGQSYPTINVYNCEDLKEIHKILGLRKTEKHITTWNKESPSQYATGNLAQNVSVTIYPKNSTFPGCQVVEEEVEVPEKVVPAQPAKEAVPEQVIPAHKEKVKKIVCH